MFTFDVVVALLDDADSEDPDIGSDDAASDGLPLLLTGASGSVSLLSLPHEDSYSS
jgi:hypothetical protein